MVQDELRLTQGFERAPGGFNSLNSRIEDGFNKICLAFQLAFQLVSLHQGLISKHIGRERNRAGHHAGGAATQQQRRPAGGGDYMNYGYGGQGAREPSSRQPPHPHPPPPPHDGAGWRHAPTGQFHRSNANWSPIRGGRGGASAAGAAAAAEAAVAAAADDEDGYLSTSPLDNRNSPVGRHVSPAERGARRGAAAIESAARLKSRGGGGGFYNDDDDYDDDDDHDHHLHHRQRNHQQRDGEKGYYGVEFGGRFKHAAEDPLGQDFDAELQGGQSWVEGGVDAWVVASSSAVAMEGAAEGGGGYEKRGRGREVEDVFFTAADEYDDEEHLPGDTRWMPPADPQGGLPRNTRWSSAGGGGGGGGLQPTSGFDGGEGIRRGGGGGASGRRGEARNSFEISSDSAGAGYAAATNNSTRRRQHHPQRREQQQRPLAPDPTPGGDGGVHPDVSSGVDDWVTPDDRPRLRAFNGDHHHHVVRGGSWGGGGVVVVPTTATTMNKSTAAAEHQRWMSKRTLF